MEPKQKRNKNIYTDRIKRKLTWRELMEKYKLTLTRLQFIVKREAEKQSA